VRILIFNYLAIKPKLVLKNSNSLGFSDPPTTNTIFSPFRLKSLVVIFVVKRMYFILKQCFVSNLRIKLRIPLYISVNFMIYTQIEIAAHKSL
jgi:hypothetical protein